MSITVPDNEALEKRAYTRRTYALDLAPLLGTATLTAAAWTADPDDSATAEGLKVLSGGPDTTLKKAEVRVEGGVPRTHYRLSCRFTDSDTNRDEVVVVLFVKP